MSKIGYYRAKFDNLTADTVKIWYKNGVPVKNCTIIVKEFCTNDKLVKYLNKNGQYRFIKFNRFFQDSYNPQQIGKVENTITSLYAAQSDTKNLGYKTERILTLVNDEVSASEMEIFADLFISPRVYLYIGTSGDSLSDWLEVTVKGSNKINFGKNKFGRIELTCLLPEHYSIKMI